MSDTEVDAVVDDEPIVEDAPPPDPKIKRAKSPVDEVNPVIRVGDWVRLGPNKAIPDHAVGRDAAVVRASIRRSEGLDGISDVGYEYQLDSDPFLVRLRDTNEEFQVTRSAFAKVGTNRADLG